MEDAEANRFMPRPFVVRSEKAGESAWVISIEGELDLNTVPQLEEALLGAESEPGTGVILDLREVDHIDSSGLRVLILSAERLNQRGEELHVACRPGAVRRLFEVSVLTLKLAIYESRTEAIAALS